MTQEQSERIFYFSHLKSMVANLLLSHYDGDETMKGMDEVRSVLVEALCKINRIEAEHSEE